MVNGLHWRVVSEPEARENWDRWLADFGDHHFRQSLLWARHKSSSWQALPTGLFNGSNPLALGLGLLRRAPLGAATLVWMNAGPVFRRKRPTAQDLAALKSYLEGLKEHLQTVRRPLLRLNIEEPMDIEAQLILRQAGFLRPIVPLGSSLTYRVDLAKSLEEIRSGLERNWRNQLGIAEKAKPLIETGRDPSLLKRYLPLHNALCERKGLKALRLTQENLEAMTQDLGSHIVFFILSASGLDGCGGALWTFGKKGWFALSAANEWGLKHNLPNAMYWHALSHLKSSGAHLFDLTGIDPKEGWGVFNFKRGLGLPAVETLGEWEWSPSNWARRAFNLALWSWRDRLP